MALLGQLTVDEILIMSVDSDPSLSGGLVAPVGSIATLDDNVNARMWIKSGAANTAWSIIPRLANSTALANGAFLFGDADGFITHSIAQARRDAATGRFSFGLNAPATPQSTIHLDRGNGVGSHVRMTAGSTTGVTAGDGTEFGIDDAGNAEIRQYESSSINFYTANVLKMSLSATGVLNIANGVSAAAITLTPGWSGGLGSWINLDVTGPSGLGTGGPGANAWIAYSAANGNWFNNSLIGDICYRNTGGRLLFGTSAGNFNMGILASGDVLFSNAIRVGTTADNTGGNLRYVADTDMQGYVGGSYRSLINTPYFAATATSSTTTTSGSDVLIDSMSITPGAGTYIAMFSTTLQSSSSGAVVLISIYANGAQVADSQRQAQPRVNASAGLGGTGNLTIDTNVSTHAIVTVGAGQAIEARWRRTGGTATALQRSLILIKVNI